MNVTIVPCSSAERHRFHLVGVLAAARHARRRQVHHAGVALLRADERRTSSPRCAPRRWPRPAAVRGGGAARPAACPSTRGTCRTGRRPPARDLRGDGARRPVRTRAHRWRGTAGRRRRRPAPPARRPGRARPARAARRAAARAARRRRCRRSARGRRSPATPSSFPAASPARHPLGRAATTAAVATSLAVMPADSSAAFQACTPSGTYGDLAEPLVPDLRAQLARRPPALDELVGDARRCRRARRRPARRRRCRRRTRRRRRRPHRFLGAAGGARCARRRSTTSVGRPRPASASSSAPTAERADAAESNARHVSGSRSAAWIAGGVRLVGVGGVGGGEAAACAGTTSAAAQGRAAPPRPPSWWSPRRSDATVRVPLPPPWPTNGGDLAAIEPPVGQVADQDRTPRMPRGYLVRQQF